MVTALALTNRVGMGGHAVGKETMVQLLENFSLPPAFKKDMVASAVHTFALRPKNIVIVRGKPVANRSITLIDRLSGGAQRLAEQKKHRQP